MKDLRVLEEQQRESQHKLTQTKLLKQNMLERQSEMEARLASLKFKNGELRVQLTRMNEVLSTSTREMEAAKLDAARSEENLKAASKELKKSLTSSRVHTSYCRKIDGRIQLVRSRESACHRVQVSRREDDRAAEKTLEETEATELRLEQSIAEREDKVQLVAEETSKVRIEVSGFAEDLQVAQEMQASTKLRAEGISAEIQSEESRQDEEMQRFKTRLVEIKRVEEELQSNREQAEKGLREKTPMLHSVWHDCIKIQVEEGHDPSLEPTEDGPLPFLDVERIVKTLRDQQDKIASAKSSCDDLLATMDQRHEEIRKLDSEITDLTKEVPEIREASEVLHRIELERTTQYESLLRKLESDHEEVDTLRVAVTGLEQNINEEKERLEKKLEQQNGVLHQKEQELEELARLLNEKKQAIEENKVQFEDEKTKASFPLARAKKEADTAKESFERMKEEVEYLKSNLDDELQKEVQEIERAQEMMLEETRVKTTRVLKGM